MLKKIFTIAALFFCCICFADGFNYEALKNPPPEIKVIKYDDGDIIWRIEKIINIIPPEIKTEFYVGPRIFQDRGALRIQILFWNDKGVIDKLSFTTTDGKKITIPIKKNDTFEERGKVFFRAVGELPLNQYIDYFVKTSPRFVEFKVPKIHSNAIQAELTDNWKQSFELFKKFFKLDNEVQVQFR